MALAGCLEVHLADLAPRVHDALGRQRLAPRQQQAHVSLEVQRVKARLEALAGHAVAVHQELGVAASACMEGMVYGKYSKFYQVLVS